MINDTYAIDINTIAKARKLNEIALTYEEDIDILKDRYVIDAKSILGIFSLDISQPLKIEYIPIMKMYYPDFTKIYLI